VSAIVIVILAICCVVICCSYCASAKAIESADSDESSDDDDEYDDDEYEEEVEAPPARKVRNAHSSSGVSHIDGAASHSRMSGGRSTAAFRTSSPRRINPVFTLDDDDNTYI